MATTYEAIATQTLGSSTASVTFSSIPQTYTDLVLIINGTASAANGVKYRINSLSTSIYGATVVYGTGSAAGSYRAGINAAYGNYGTALATSGNGTIIANFMNYSNSSTFKTTLVRCNPTTSEVAACVGLAATTDAITSITSLFDTAATFSTGSTFTLYGIKAA